MPTNDILRFGNFEVDLPSGELRRGGLKVKLTGQPFQVLVTLLEKPGQVVTREELHQKLWAQDTFVDFEHGLNKAINKVRDALGDDADNPRFIETLPRRGYRFLPPITAPTEPEAPAARQAISPQPPTGPEAPVSNTAQPRSRSRLWLSAISVAAVVLVLVLPAIKSIPPRPPRVLRYTQLTHDGLQKGRLATDGSRIYFDEQSPRRIVAQVSVRGGAVTSLAALPNPIGSDSSPVLDYSPARSELLLRGGIDLSPLWALSVPGGSAPRRLGDFLVLDAAWSPDGQSIVYSKINELDTAKADGSEPRKFAALNGTPLYPRWSPDRKLLRFTTSKYPDNLRTSLWEISSDGSNLHPLFPDWLSREDEGGSWTPDGRYFIFRSVRNGSGSIYAMRERKGLLGRRVSEPIELTSGPLSFSVPVSSMDGKQIFVDGFLDRGELMRYDQQRHAWARYLSGISAADLDFSRDGEWVTYTLVPEGTLWRSRVDGSERLQLTIPPLRTSMPRWSPDGKNIVFAGLKPGGAWTIYLLSADGGTSEALAPDTRLQQDPNWSQDGTRIVYGEGNFSPAAIHVFDLRSHRVSDLPESKGLFSPRWSPDGRFIVAMTAIVLPDSSEVPPMKLMLFDLSRQKWQEWFQAPSIAYPAFSRSGKYLYFSDSSAGFYRVRLGDKKVERVAAIDVPGEMKMDDFWYWTGLAPDDSPMFLRDASTREIYALDVDFP
jgi:Tol biopolymer transport system component/DNA-binding winged helix-turn-helix (wHTH) protein